MSGAESRARKLSGESLVDQKAFKLHFEQGGKSNCGLDCRYTSFSNVSRFSCRMEQLQTVSIYSSSTHDPQFPPRVLCATENRDFTYPPIISSSKRTAKRIAEFLYLTLSRKLESLLSRQAFPATGLEVSSGSAYRQA